jgi:GNAT superfamily N-acetyltransferase
MSIPFRAATPQVVEGATQRRGIGTAVMHRLIDEAAGTGRPMTFGVVRRNPARWLYERLGFRVTNEDEREFYMRREAPPKP